MNDLDILVLDSGVGGLTIADQILAKEKDLSLAYFADFAEFPYGQKSEQWLTDRLLGVLNRLAPEVSPKLVVVACNTASTTVLPTLRKHFQFPIVGVVPAIKPAAELSKEKCIGLLATPGTVKRPYTKQLIDDFAKGHHVISIGSHEMVTFAEQKLRGITIDPGVLKTICKDFYSESGKLLPDQIVLGCTHFPHLLDELKVALGSTVSFLDSGKAIANRVSFLLTGLIKKKISNPKKYFFTSDLSQVDQGLRYYLQGLGFVISERELRSI